jgi:hypothetical protein
LFTTLQVHKTVLTTVKCAVVRLRALMAQQSSRLITNRPNTSRRTVIDKLIWTSLSRARAANVKAKVRAEEYLYCIYGILGNQPGGRGNLKFS